jgi:hypothetical protein
MKFRTLAWITAMTLFTALAMPVRIVAQEQEQQKQVKMTFSGTEASNTINLHFPDTHNGEFNFAGSGTLGSFTFRNVEAEAASPQHSSTCSATQVYFPTVAGAGVFRFQDGSLLKVKLTEGFDCIDFAAMEAHCTRTFQITGGTRRFKDASGALTLTETVVPVLADAGGNPVFFAATGKFKGTVSGVATEEERQDERQ